MLLNVCNRTIDFIICAYIFVCLFVYTFICQFKYFFGTPNTINCLKKESNCNNLVKMSAVVDSSATFSGFEESMTKRPMYTDQHHSELVFHRYSLLREKNLLTDAVILSSDDKR